MALSNIEWIVDSALCTGCGACSGICPTNAIAMRSNDAGYLLAAVHRQKCNNCGICRSICPSVPENNTLPQDCDDPFHGPCLNAYIGHATDPQIRQDSQSGGIVTALLCYLLEEARVEAAVVNRYNSERNRPEAFCATTQKDIINAAGSYYCQTPVVQKIMEEHREKRLAAVTLGCQSEALALIRQRYPRVSTPAYVIGLICAGQYSAHYMDNLLSLSCHDDCSVTGFRFKDKSAGGWPGNVKVYTDIEDYVLDKKHRLFLKPIYQVYRCLLCYDQMNVHSDIVAGDPWGIQNEENKRGNTVVLTRTEKGERLIEAAAEKNFIQVAKLQSRDVINGQTVDGRLKTQFFTATTACRAQGHPLPENMCSFNELSYLAASRKQYKAILEQLNFSRRVYLTDSAQHAHNIRTRKKTELRRKRRLALPLTIAKRVRTGILRRARSAAARRLGK